MKRREFTRVLDDGRLRRWGRRGDFQCDGEDSAGAPYAQRVDPTLASHPKQESPLATGAVAASTILFLRVAVAVTVLDATVLPVLARYLAAPFAASVAALLVAWRSLRGAQVEPTPLKNPLQFRSALEMAVLFQVVLFAVHYVRSSVGESGLLASGFVLGLTDVDALTLSMTRSVASGTPLEAAARAITMGIVANSLMKAGIAVVVGSGRFRWHAGFLL